MKNYAMFNYNFLFSDHFAKLSDQAKLYYIKLNFYADNGFVSNPLQVLDSLNYDHSVLDELITNGDILTLPDRNEVFITLFFVHNKGAKHLSWLNSPFKPYWFGKLFIKKENGVATLKPQAEPVDSGLDEIKKEIDSLNQPNGERADWDAALDPIKN